MLMAFLSRIEVFMKSLEIFGLGMFAIVLVISLIFITTFTMSKIINDLEEKNKKE